MTNKAKYLSLVLFIFFIASCRSNKGYQKQDSYQEISDINVHQRPKTIAKEIGELTKKQQKAYKRQLKRTKRQMERRNKKKLKKIVPKGVKTKKATRTKSTPKQD